MRQSTACEAESAQTWIAANSKPRHFYTDIFTRPMLRGTSGYIIGFPCQPFSRLNNFSTVWADPRVKVLWKAVDWLLHALPAWAVLENVRGLLRWISGLTSRLRSRGFIRQYIVLVVPLCPREHLSEPARRPRLYFICIRRDVALSIRPHILCDMVAKLVKATRAKFQAQALPLSAYRVQGRRCAMAAGARMTRGSHTVAGPRKATWVKKHAELKNTLGSAPSSLSCVVRGAKDLGLTDRMVDCMDIAARKCRGHLPSTSTMPFTADVSQSGGRVPVGIGDEVPTITRCGRLVHCSSDNVVNEISC